MTAPFQSSDQSSRSRARALSVVEHGTLKTESIANPRERLPQTLEVPCKYVLNGNAGKAACIQFVTLPITQGTNEMRLLLLPAASRKAASSQTLNPTEGPS